MEAQTILTTAGDDFAFDVYTDEDATAEEQKRLHRETVQVALIVHALDVRPRTTVIFHQASLS